MGLVSFGEKYELRKGRAESILVVSLGRDAEVRPAAVQTKRRDGTHKPGGKDGPGIRRSLLTM